MWFVTPLGNGDVYVNRLVDAPTPRRGFTYFYNKTIDRMGKLHPLPIHLLKALHTHLAMSPSRSSDSNPVNVLVVGKDSISVQPRNGRAMTYTFRLNDLSIMSASEFRETSDVAIPKTHRRCCDLRQMLIRFVKSFK